MRWFRSLKLALASVCSNAVLQTYDTRAAISKCAIVENVILVYFVKNRRTMRRFFTKYTKSTKGYWKGVCGGCMFVV